jgi:uncharacterized protein YecT (DUF1311 family)
MGAVTVVSARVWARLGGIILTAILLVCTAHAEDVTCDNGGAHVDEDRCLGERLKKLDGELNRVYKLALAAMPEHDPQDSRKEREQLRKSQRAWLTFLDEDCALKGAMEGGSNAWVSTFSGLCKEKEIENRIAFLKSIADHSHGG